MVTLDGKMLLVVKRWTEGYSLMKYWLFGYAYTSALALDEDKELKNDKHEIIESAT